MSDFAKWLGENDVWFAFYHERDKGDVHPSHRARYVSIRALGEWAYKDFRREWGKSFDAWIPERGFKETLKLYTEEVNFSIAVACLGVKEVERRLSEARK